MDIASLSIVNNHNKINDAASLLVLKKAMDVSKENAAGMTELLKQPAVANLGNILDRTV